MMKKIMAGLFAAVMAMSFAACSENGSDDESSKKTTKSVTTSAAEPADSEDSSEEETTTTTTTTTAETTTTTEETTTTTTAEAPKVPTGEGAYDGDDFAAVFDTKVWQAYDASSVDLGAASDLLGIDLNSSGTNLNCIYTNINDPTVTVNIVSTSVPGMSADMDVTQFIDYFKQMFDALGDSFTLDSVDGTKVGANNAINVQITADLGTGTVMKEEQYDIFADGKMIAVTFTSGLDNYKDHESEFKAVLDSLVIK